MALVEITPRPAVKITPKPAVKITPGPLTPKWGLGWRSRNDVLHVDFYELARHELRSPWNCRTSCNGGIVCRAIGNALWQDFHSGLAIIPGPLENDILHEVGGSVLPCCIVGLSRYAVVCYLFQANYIDGQNFCTRQSEGLVISFRAKGHRQPEPLHTTK